MARHSQSLPEKLQSCPSFFLPGWPISHMYDFVQLFSVRMPSKLQHLMNFHALKGVIGPVVPSCWQVNQNANEILDALSNMIQKENSPINMFDKGKKLSVQSGGRGGQIQAKVIVGYIRYVFAYCCYCVLDYWGRKAPGSCYYALLGSSFPSKSCLRARSSMKAKPIPCHIHAANTLQQLLYFNSFNGVSMGEYVKRSGARTL